MKARLLIATFAALSVLGATVADAASRKQKRQKVYRNQAPAVMHGAVPAPSAYPDPAIGGRRPAWAGPNECFTDEGYGRYVPCSLSKDSL